jgi:hypothetical protein
MNENTSLPPPVLERYSLHTYMNKRLYPSRMKAFPSLSGKFHLLNARVVSIQLIQAAGNFVGSSANFDEASVVPQRKDIDIPGHKFRQPKRSSQQDLHCIGEGKDFENSERLVGSEPQLSWSRNFR